MLNQNFKPTSCTTQIYPMGTAFAPMDQKSTLMKEKGIFRRSAMPWKPTITIGRSRANITERRSPLKEFFQGKSGKAEKIAKQDRELASAEDYERHKIAAN